MQSHRGRPVASKATAITLKKGAYLKIKLGIEPKPLLYLYFFLAVIMAAKLNLDSYRRVDGPPRKFSNHFL